MFTPDKLAKLQTLTAGYPSARFICDDYLSLRLRVHWNDRILQAPFADLSPSLNWREMQAEYPALHLEAYDCANGVFCRTFADLTRPFELQNEDLCIRKSLEARSQYEIMAKEKHRQHKSMLEMIERPLQKLGNRQLPVLPGKKSGQSYSRPRIPGIPSRPGRRRYATASLIAVHDRRPSFPRIWPSRFQVRPLNVRAACLASVSVAVSQCLGRR